MSRWEKWLVKEKGRTRRDDLIRMLIGRCWNMNVIQANLHHHQHHLCLGWVAPLMHPLWDPLLYNHDMSCLCCHNLLSYTPQSAPLIQQISSQLIWALLPTNTNITHPVKQCSPASLTTIHTTLQIHYNAALHSVHIHSSLLLTEGETPY